MNLADSERRTHPPGGHFAPRNQLRRISTPRFHDLRRRRVGPPALKRGLWRVGDLKLDEVGGRDTAHLSGKMLAMIPATFGTMPKARWSLSSGALDPSGARSIA